MARSTGRDSAVGLLVLIALALAAGAIFLIGSQENLFASTNRYTVRFTSASGLSVGNPVQLNGVNVGRIRSMKLPQDPREKELEVQLEVDRRYAGRIREDSTARIRTLGLLGDKYVQITSGSADLEPIPPDGIIPAAQARDVDRLLNSGEDFVEKVVSISDSLDRILARVDRGEGLIGELTSDPETGAKVTGSLIETLDSIQKVTDRIEHGDGILPRLLYDEELGDSLVSAIRRFETVMASIEDSEGLWNTVISKRAPAQSLESLLANLDQASADIRGLTTELSRGEGTLGTLIHDEDMAARVRSLIQQLEEVSTKLNQGEGTAAQLINDPQVYEAVNDILVGIDESVLLRWLIRNRQKAGIEKRYDDAQAEESGSR